MRIVRDDSYNKRVTLVLNIGKEIRKTHRIKTIPKRYTIKISQLEKIYGQKRLAEMLSVHPRTIRKWKSKETGISERNLQKLGIQYQSFYEEKTVSIYEPIVITKEELPDRLISEGIRYGYDFEWQKEYSKNNHAFVQMYTVIQYQYKVTDDETGEEKGTWGEVKFYPLGAFYPHSFVEMVNLMIPEIMKKLNKSAISKLRLYRLGTIFYAKKTDGK